MINDYFVSLEDCQQGHQQPLHRVLDNLSYNEQGNVFLFAGG
ncbi:hypothetical protein [Pseudomaricurvus alkylphenolicus]|nr:hypothetical protein [Pseudomaricurvus alkylphenolicus]